jgi:hypothetical protein
MWCYCSKNHLIERKFMACYDKEDDFLASKKQALVVIAAQA